MDREPGLSVYGYAPQGGPITPERAYGRTSRYHL